MPVRVSGSEVGQDHMLQRSHIGPKHTYISVGNVWECIHGKTFFLRVLRACRLAGWLAGRLAGWLD